MPWPPQQRKAIAARMNREGKSRAEISRFFRAHGHGKKSPRRHLYEKAVGRG
jgi:DNA-binding CsgD family transcriptional regulator